MHSHTTESKGDPQRTLDMWVAPNCDTKQKGRPSRKPRLRGKTALWGLSCHSGSHPSCCAVVYTAAAPGGCQNGQDKSPPQQLQGKHHRHNGQDPGSKGSHLTRGPQRPRYAHSQMYTCSRPHCQVVGEPFLNSVGFWAYNLNSALPHNWM